MKLTHYRDIKPYVTKDGSRIRELMHPDQHGNHLQSLAEATIRPGTKTQLHQHLKTEELYHIMAGEGRMTLGSEQFYVGIGDTVYIAPGAAHCMANTGKIDLKILCCCTPAYCHDDTELLESN